jgi:hypothetical protein
MLAVITVCTASPASSAARYAGLAADSGQGTNAVPSCAATAPSAPAFDTAAASAGVATPAIGAWKMGWSRASRSRKPVMDRRRFEETTGRLA